MEYKWSNPHEWFESSLIDRYKDDAAELLRLCVLLSGQLDSDQMQDLFEPEMDADGYFEEVR